MNRKFGEVCEVKPNQAVVYYDGHSLKDVNIDVLRAFLGDQIKELQALVGHSIQIVKDRSGRIQKIQIID